MGHQVVEAPEPWRTDRWYFQTAVYTWHFHPTTPPSSRSRWTRRTYSTSAGSGGNGSWDWGLFSNSFGQFSQYMYGGLKWRPIPDHQPFYVKVSAGVLHGYSGEYQDKIPFQFQRVCTGHRSFRRILLGALLRRGARARRRRDDVHGRNDGPLSVGFTSRIYVSGVPGR
jgi:hypothetical protein